MAGNLEVREVSVVLNSGQEILKRVSSEFPAGLTTVVLGPSGSGKSTLIKTAAFLRPPEKGRVLYEGEQIDLLSESRAKAFRRRTGFMFQDGALWANSSIYENFALPLRYHFPDMSEPQVEDRVMEAASRIGFIGNIHARPSDFSAGRQKLISFVRSIITDPDMLLVDEPSTFVDWRSLDRLIQWFSEFKKSGRTLVLVTHEAALASQLADRLVILDDGRVIAQGTIEEVLASEDPQVQAETKSLRSVR